MYIYMCVLIYIIYSSYIHVQSWSDWNDIIEQVWNTSTGEELFCCEGLSEDPNESVLCVNISGDNNRIVASAVNGRVVVSTSNYLHTHTHAYTHAHTHTHLYTHLAMYQSIIGLALSISRH